MAAASASGEVRVRGGSAWGRRDRERNRFLHLAGEFGDMGSGDVGECEGGRPCISELFDRLRHSANVSSAISPLSGLPRIIGQNGGREPSYLLLHGLVAGDEQLVVMLHKAA